MSERQAQDELGSLSQNPCAASELKFSQFTINLERNKWLPSSKDMGSFHRRRN